MAEIQFRFGTEEYKNAKLELDGYQAQLGSLTQKLEPCEANKDLQVQEYNDAISYDNEYSAAEANLGVAESELSQLSADMSKIEKAVKRNSDGEVTSYTDVNGDKIRNNDKATAEYNRQKSLIQQKIQTATQNRDAAIQEKERIIQERSAKQLKETQIEQQEAAAAEKEFEDLNAEINALNNKIAPLDEAIKKADEDKVDVAAQNNKNWDWYAEKELKAEGIENPSKADIRARAEEIKQRNIELGNCDKDGNLIVGKTIVTLTGKNNGVADDMATAEEAVGQYTSAIRKEASQAIENALGQLSPEEKAVYNSLSSDQKATIQDQVLECINKGKGNNALSIIKQTIGPEVARIKAEEEAKRQAEIEQGKKDAEAALKKELSNLSEADRERIVNTQDMSDSEIDAVIGEIMGDLSKTITVGDKGGQDIGKLTGRLAKKYGAKNAQKILGRICNTAAKKAGKAVPGMNVAMAGYGVYKVANGDMSGFYDIADVAVSYIPVVGTAISLVGTENIVNFFGACIEDARSGPDGVRRWETLANCM